MIKLKNLLVLALGLTTAFALTACDVDEDPECNEAGVCDDGEGGTVVEDDAGVTAPEYTWVYIVDTSEDANQAGTPGADICGITYDCNGTIDSGVDSDTTGLGDNICLEEVTDICGGTTRGDGVAALDAGDTCEGDSDPSDYVSLGMSGSLLVDMGVDLQGCSLEIVELVGGDLESYDVYVCTNATATDCLTNEVLGSAPEGGSILVDVPAAAEADAQE